MKFSLFFFITFGITFPNAALFASTLRFLGDLNIPSKTQFLQTDLGGLSGISYNDPTKTLIALSDDRSENQSARFYTFALSLEPTLSLHPIAVTFLKQKDGNRFPKGSVDPEGITSLDSNHFIFSSERSARVEPRTPPAIFEVHSSGSVLNTFLIPEKFFPESYTPETRGVVDNCSFEGVSVTPDGSSLFTATECPLIQDDTPSSFIKGALSRILKFDLKAADRKAVAEYAYRTEPNDEPMGADRDLRNGISDILFLNDHEFFVLERGTAAVRETVTNRIRLFKASIDMNTTNLIDVSSLSMAGPLRVNFVRKELVLDLNEIIPELDLHWPTLDNIEGLAFGPLLQNGNRSLLMISDDNFNPKQRTQFLAFELIDSFSQ